MTLEKLSSPEDADDVLSDQQADASPDPVDDDAGSEAARPPPRYDISSFGADYDADGVVKRLRQKKIFIPPFQRAYVWSLKDASRFVESLLMGLPVPGVFLAREPDTNKLLVIDGQQRLKSLEYFYDGYFNPRDNEQRKRVFALSSVAPQYEGKTYNTLEGRDRTALDDAIIHATIIRQDGPAEDDTSIYHIFERLNSGGRKLAPQEIRTAIYHGTFIDSLVKWNQSRSWRNIYGKPSPRLKDQELILRFLALYFDIAHYARPMGDFVSRFVKKHRNSGDIWLAECEKLFVNAVDTLWQELERQALRPARTLNAALMDAVLVGLATAQSHGVTYAPGRVAAIYRQLLDDEQFVEEFSRSTADELFVKSRIETATRLFTAA